MGRWSGPCPPPGHGQHRYFFRLHALDARVDVGMHACRAARTRASARRPRARNRGAHGPLRTPSVTGRPTRRGCLLPAGPGRAGRPRSPDSSSSCQHDDRRSGDGAGNDEAEACGRGLRPQRISVLDGGARTVGDSCPPRPGFLVVGARPGTALAGRPLRSSRGGRPSRLLSGRERHPVGSGGTPVACPTSMRCPSGSRR